VVHANTEFFANMTSSELKSDVSVSSILESFSFIQKWSF